MVKIHRRQTKYYIFTFLIFFGIQIENIFTGLDTFGFILGLYGILLQHPQNQFASLLILIVIIFVGYIIGVYLEGKGYFYSHLIAILFASTIYLFMMKNALYFSLIANMLLLTFVLLIDLHITKRNNPSLYSLNSNLKQLYAILFVVILSGVIGYLRWIQIGYPPVSENLDPSFQTPFLLILMGKKNNYEINFPFAPYTVNYSDFSKNYRLGFGISIIFTTVTLVLLIFLTWQRINHLIDKLQITPVILKIDTNGEEKELAIRIKQLENAKWSDRTNSNTDVSLKLDANYFEMGDLLNFDLQRLFLTSREQRNQFVYSQNSLSLESENEVVSSAKEMSRMLRLIDIIQIKDYNIKPIVLQNYYSPDLFLENHILNRKNNGFIDIGAKFYTPIRFVKGGGLPIQLSKGKLILHLGSNDLNSYIIDRNIKSLTNDFDVKYEFIRIDSDESFEEVKKITSEVWDFLIITLHSSYDKEDGPFFYIGNGYQKITHENFRKIIQKPPLITLIPSCLSFIGNSNNHLPIQLIEMGSFVTLSSISPVLSSHLALILLSCLEVLLPLEVLSLASVQEMLELVYKNIKKFGYLIQWTTFRTIVRIDPQF